MVIFSDIVPDYLKFYKVLYIVFNWFKLHVILS